MPDLLDELARHGQARTAALQRAEVELEAIGALAARALAQGASKVEIARRAQISRPTLDAVLQRAGD